MTFGPEDDGSTVLKIVSEQTTWRHVAEHSIFHSPSSNKEQARFEFHVK